MNNILGVKKEHVCILGLMGVKYYAPIAIAIGKQCGKRSVVGTMICWQHLRQRHNLFIADSNITQRVGRREVPIGKVIHSL